MIHSVEWLDEARASLVNISSFIGEEAPDAAERLVSVIEDTADALPQNPFMYRRGRVPGTREAVVHPNYILVYRVERHQILILDVVHSRQQYP